jgi:adenylylsulfate kinase-like enzyme
MAKSLFSSNEFKEIYVSTPLKIAEKEIQKGSIKKRVKEKFQTLPELTVPMKNQ